MMIEWTAVPPNPSQALYAHTWGIKGATWAQRGLYERTYWISPECMRDELRQHLPATVLAIAHVIESELRAAVAAEYAPDLRAVWDRTFGPERAHG